MAAVAGSGRTAVRPYGWGRPGKPRMNGDGCGREAAAPPTQVTNLRYRNGHGCRLKPAVPGTAKGWQESGMLMQSVHSGSPELLWLGIRLGWSESSRGR